MTSLRRALINPRTAGRRLYLGKDLGAGAWPAILDAETHSALETKLTDPRRRTAPADLSAKFLLSGLATCGKCGQAMFASPYRSKGREIMVNRCHGGYRMSRRLDLVDEVVNAVVCALAQGFGALRPRPVHSRRSRPVWKLSAAAIPLSGGGGSGPRRAAPSHLTEDYNGHGRQD